MKNEEIKIMAKRLQNEVNYYQEIGNILGVKLFAARKMCTCVPEKGPKPIIDKKIQLRIVRAISTLKSTG